jgi:translation initiation factor IF-3
MGARLDEVMIEGDQRREPRQGTAMNRSKVRINDDITATTVSVVGPDGKLAVMPTAEALHLARGQGLDLVEVEPGADPPVCKISGRRR